MSYGEHSQQTVPESFYLANNTVSRLLRISHHFLVVDDGFQICRFENFLKC